MLALLWVLQTFFLDTIYKQIKLSQINNTAAQIVQNIDNDLETTLNTEAESDGLCIHIFDQYGRTLYSVGTRPFCFMQQVGPIGFEQLVSYAESNGGNYLTAFEFNTILDDRPPQSDPKSGYLLVRTVNAEKGMRVIIIDTTITPLDSTVSTLQFTLLLTTIVTVAAAAIVALVLSRQISMPIESINNSARQLSEGKFNSSFKTSYPEIDELCQTLSAAAVEIARTDDLKRQLFANVSHDLRTPLTMITGYAEAMRDIPGENTPENVQVVIDEARRLSRLVNDMLDLSRLQSTTTYTPAQCNLTALIEDILQRYNKLKETQGYTVQFLHSGEAFILGDELRMSQVLYNLVNNAIDFTGEDQTVVVEQIILPGRVRIEVRDSGDGIPPDQLEHIWERYYKANQHHKRSRVGTGLGLSIVKEALTIHNAQYGVESAATGTTFWFELQTIPPHHVQNMP